MAQSLDTIATNSTSYADFTTKAKAAGYDLNDSSTGQKALDAWNKAKNKSSNSSNSSSNSVKGSITDPFDVMKASRGESKISNMSDAYKTGIESEGDFKDKFNDAILKQLKLESDLHTQINESMGLTGELSAAFRDSLIGTLPAAATLGYDISNISDAITSLSEKTGKWNIIASNTLEQGFQTARAFGMTLPQLSDAFGEFEKVGLGAADTILKINTAGMQSVSLGLNSKKTTQDLKTNIEKLNEFGFKNGVEGLNRMVQKAAEFRMNMAETFKVAEKVMNPESAIELTANMQMLGGAIGDLNDPLKLMYMATNNVEGLQDALQGAASTLATYNTEQKRFEITGANLRRAQEMAKVLGVDYKEFTKGAIAAQERILANDTLLSKGFDIDDKDREFLTNLSSMKDGEMQIVIPKSLQDSLGKELGANELKLSDLSTEQKNILINYRKQLEDKTPAEMAKAMFSETTKIAYNTEATARAFVIGAKDTTFGKEDRWKGPMAPIVETTSKLRKTQYGLTKDSQWMEKNNPIKGLVDAMDKVGVPLKVAVDNTVKSFEKLNDELLKMTRKYKTEEQEKIDKENERKQESSKAKNSGNASVNHYHTFKISKTNNLENYSIDQTSKGYTGNQTIPYDPDNMA